VHKFQEGDKASVMKDGAEVEMIVFHQSGELVSLFDRTNRFYLFHVMDVRPVRSSLSSISMYDAFSEPTMREH
jgi:hypothetical protein